MKQIVNVMLALILFSLPTLQVNAAGQDSNFDKALRNEAPKKPMIQNGKVLKKPMIQKRAI